MLQHAPRDVGVQVQAGDQRHRVTDHGAQALQQFTLGVVHMFGHRSPVQVEIDGVEAALFRVADDLRGDALEGVARDVCRGAAPAQAEGASVQPRWRALRMKPPIGMLVPPRRPSIAAPTQKAGKAEPLSNAGQSALLGAKVLVSCWKPATKMRMRGFR